MSCVPVIAKNPVKDRLAHGHPSVGSWLWTPSCVAAEALSYAGFEWIVIDTEHGAVNPENVENIIRTIERTNVVPMVRVGWNDPVLIKLALDRGAMGIVVPWVSTREEAERAASACMFPPKGLRGIGGGRTTMYGLDGGRYMRDANDSIMVIAQIETAQAVENIDDILSVEGVGAAFVGPADLSASLGIPGQLDDEIFERAVSRVLAAAKKHGVPAGMYLASPDAVARRIQQGWQLMALANDVDHMINGARQALATVRSMCGDER